MLIPWRVHLQIVGLSIIIRWFQGGLESTSSSPEYLPKKLCQQQTSSGFVSNCTTQVVLILQHSMYIILLVGLIYFFCLPSLAVFLDITSKPPEV